MDSDPRIVTVLDTVPATPTAQSAGPRALNEQTAYASSRSIRLEKLLSYLILACGLWTMVVGARQIITSHSLVPLWDEWQEIDAIASAPHHQLPLKWLWSQHSEHRVVFYRLLLLADIHVFHGNHWISFWCMLGVQCSFFLALALMMRSAGVQGSLWRVIVGLAGFALFSPSQWENFGWAFQISFLLPGLFTLLALWMLMKHNDEVSGWRSGSYLAISILFGIAATYSNANGVVVWPLLIVAAIAVCVRWRTLAVYAASGAVSITSYLYGYSSPSYHSSPLQSIRHPVSLMTYAAGYLGVVLPPWVRVRDAVAVATGAAGLLIAVLATWWVVTRKRRKSIHIVFLGLMHFAISTAVVTALGRIGFGLNQAFSSRYQTFNLLFWFSTVTLVLLIADELRLRWRLGIVIAVAVATSIATLVFPLGLRASRTRTQQAEAASSALLAGIPYTPALKVLYVDPLLVWRDAQYFREQRLFMFSDSANDHIGQPLSSIYTISPADRCQGDITDVQWVSAADLLDDHAPALRIAGTATRLPSKSPVDRLILTAGGTVVGYAAAMAGPFGAKHSDIIRDHATGNWLGFATPPDPPQDIHVYAVDAPGSTVCAVASVVSPAR